MERQPPATGGLQLGHTGWAQEDRYVPPYSVLVDEPGQAGD